MTYWTAAGHRSGCGRTRRARSSRCGSSAALVPRHVPRCGTTLSPVSADIGTKARSATSSFVAKLRTRRGSPRSAPARIDQVHLVDARPRGAGSRAAWPGRRGAGTARARRCGRRSRISATIGRRGAGHHVAGVLDVPGRVGDDEFALRRGEVAVGHVDGDALLAFGPQAVGEQRQVGSLVPARRLMPLDRTELVFEDRLAVEQQAADQGGLAVIDRAGGRDPKELASMLEVALLLAVFHTGFGDPVVGPGRARAR